MNVTLMEFMHLHHLRVISSIMVLLLSLAIPLELHAVEKAFQVYIRPKPNKRAVRYVDRNAPTETELQHIPRINVTEYPEYYWFDTWSDNPMTTEHCIEGYYIYIRNVVVSKIQLTPGKSLSAIAFGINKQYILPDGDTLNVVAMCNLHDAFADDWVYHPPTANISYD